MSLARLTAIGGAVALALTVALGAASSSVLASPNVGETAPDFVGTDTKGKQHKLSDLRGKTVILEWTNHGCPYVKKHYGAGNMQALQKKAKADGIVWLSVISSAPGTQGHVDGSAADKLTADRGAAPSAVLLDPEGKIGRLYGAQTTPHMYIITPDGKLVYKGAIDNKPTTRVGDIKTATNYVTNALQQISAGKPVSPAVTRAYGCSVKYAN